MPNFLSQSDNQTAVMRMLIVAFIVLLGVLAYTITLLKQASQTEYIDIPAYTLNGKLTRVTPGVMQKNTVYNFAERTFQVLNRWKYDGSVEYPERIKELGSFMTPSYKAFVRRDKNRRLGNDIASELRNRSRMMLPILSGWDPARVEVLGKKDGKPNAWVAYLDMELLEYYKGEEIKHKYIRYPMRVVLDTSDPVNNPSFLALDGYQDQPKELSKDMETK